MGPTSSHPGVTAVSTPSLDMPRGGTRWRRTGAVLGPSLVAAVALIVATLRGPIPINLTISGQDIKLSSNGGAVELPQGLTLYPSTVQMKYGGETRGVMIAGLPEAVLTKGLCISLVLSFPGFGTYTVRLHTSGRTTAHQMTLDAAGLNAGLATLAAGAGGKDPIELGPPARGAFGPTSDAHGRFGIAAPGAGSLRALQANAQGAIIAGTVDLNGLKVKVNKGSGVRNGECY
jgi:hypothetical protein